MKLEIHLNAVTVDQRVNFDVFVDSAFLPTDLQSYLLDVCAVVAKRLGGGTVGQFG